MAGREFSLALKTDGTVVGWGNSNGNRITPPSGLIGVIDLSSGIYHTLALKADGTVTGWGSDGNELLDIPADLNEVIAVAAGGFHSLALRRNGTVVCWGFGGDGRTSPPSDLVDVVAIDAGRDHSVALKADGTVVSWGLNDKGQTNVPAGLRNVIAIAAGDSHTLALKTDGTVLAWGNNENGRATVPTGLSNVVAIDAGARHSLALRANGTVKGWGDNSNGQLNLSGSDIHAIAAGGYHTLALRSAGPKIITQPRSQASLSGSSVTLTAGATGEGLTYQWQLNGRDIPGATGATLTITNVGRGNAGSYSVKITNASGTVVSGKANLIVHGRLKANPLELRPTGTVRLSFQDEFGDPITEPKKARYRVEVSEDLETWTPFNRPLNIAQGRLQVEDPDAKQFKQRFYRVVEK